MHHHRLPAPAYTYRVRAFNGRGVSDGDEVRVGGVRLRIGRLPPAA
ncbi:MAG: hypothetical protein MUF34_36030 [Polyangiaceae bacterium]|nr:hypothetical protein [Polyangiaceae bacterium]